MKMNLFKRYVFLNFLFVLLSGSGVISAVTWDGSGGNDPADVTNMDLILNGGIGDITLPLGKTVITADTADVNVTLASASVILEGNGGGASQLFLCVAKTKKIIFDIIDLDLTFLGSSDGPKTPLLIIIGGVDGSGSGAVEFKIKGDRTVSFTSDGTHGPTQLYLFMGNPGDDPTDDPTLKFFRDTSGGNLAKHITVLVGENSRMSYLSILNVGVGTKEGTIEFDAANTNATGRMVLQIKDKGAVIIAGHRVAGPKLSIDLAKINLAMPAASNAIFKACNGVSSNATAGLLIENENNSLFDLLINPFLQNPNPFNGMRYGFVLGANGTFEVCNNAYLDYVGLTLNACPSVAEIPGFEGIDTEGLIKKRNPSAFFVDGNANSLATDAQIMLGTCSAMFFRSGVDSAGNANTDLSSDTVFTVTDTAITRGAGNIVFDVEGEVDITGQSAINSKLEILSLQVDPTGGKLFVDGTCPTIFPLRTFNKDAESDFLQYNNAAFFVNTTMNLKNTSLMHTDENHKIFPQDDINSEPAYVGGELFTLDPSQARPKITFCDSRFLLHTSAAFAGVDLLAPECDCTGDGNQSKFIFYYNGKKIDARTGRQLVLGTQPGSFACDGCNIISRDAHLDVMQKAACGSIDPCVIKHWLSLEVDANGGSIVESLVRSQILNQFSIHTIFLGHSSNISVGSQSNFASPTNTKPMLKIAGNFFSFETRGGSKGLPDMSNVTGEGGIFVDNNGTFCIGAHYIASMATMVTKSGSGKVNLPKNQVFFDRRIGISDWQLDLSKKETIIGKTQCISDYTLNWLDVKKNFDTFCPYTVLSTTSCACPPVLANNIDPIPTVEGEVGQLQIQGSRIGDPAHIKIDGGWVRELVFLTGNYSAQAPTAVAVLQNNARLGLGSGHKNVDSLEASFVLGVNGVSLIANGNSFVELNEDIIINNVCSILKGPEFDEGVDKLRINADCCRILRIKPTGILDLRCFGANTIEFNGKVKVLLEPGAQIWLDGATLRFNDTTCIVSEPFVKVKEMFKGKIKLTSTDDFRVKIIGKGTFEWNDYSCMLIEKNSFVGIESLYETRQDACDDPDCDGDGNDTVCLIKETDIKFLLNDCSSFFIGASEDPVGGSLQVGNTVTTRTGHEVSFSLCLQGTGARFTIKQEGFFGLGVGIVDKASSIPNDWKVNNLFNVKKITLQLNDGQFAHDRIYSGDDARASLLAISNESAVVYDLKFEEQATGLDTIAEKRLRDANMNGGGNMILLDSPGDNVNPTVLDVDDVFADRVRATVFASSYLQVNNSLTGVPGALLFAALKTPDLSKLGQTTTAGNFAAGECSFRKARTGGRVSLIDRGRIGRYDAWDVIGAGGLGTPGGGSPESRRERAADIGAVHATVGLTGTPPGELLLASQVQ